MRGWMLPLLVLFAVRGVDAQGPPRDVRGVFLAVPWPAAMPVPGPVAAYLGERLGLASPAARAEALRRAEAEGWRAPRCPSH